VRLRNFGLREGDVGIAGVSQMRYRTAGLRVTVSVCDEPERYCASPACEKPADLVVRISKRAVTCREPSWCVEHWRVLRALFIRWGVPIRYGKGAAERIGERAGAGGRSSDREVAVVSGAGRVRYKVTFGAGLWRSLYQSSQYLQELRVSLKSVGIHARYLRPGTDGIVMPRLYVEHSEHGELSQAVCATPFQRDSENLEWWFEWRSFARCPCSECIRSERICRIGSMPYAAQIIAGQL
jgi:hypothetical protein